MNRVCGLIYGSDLHHLDHLAPFLSILSKPLIVTDPHLFQVAKEYYPGLEVRLLSPLGFGEPILREFDVLISSLPRGLLDPLFFFDEHKMRKKLLSLWLPHGNSDKDNLGGLSHEKIVLVYGEEMIDTLKKKGVLEKLFRYPIIGNFRKLFYEKNKLFYDSLIQKKISFKNPHKTLLYAPTWGPNDHEALALLDKLPSHYNMLVKLHPNTTTKGFYPALKEKYQHKDNICFIENIPTIYPLLEISDIYIGDHSSIAYDFLVFDRPLFFLTPKASVIHHTGQIATPDTLFSLLEEEDLFHEARASIYSYAFDSSVRMESLPALITKTCDDYFTNEIHIL